MKTIIALLSLFTITASAQTIVTTNLLNFTYVNGTNNGNVYYETNVLIPIQNLVIQTTGITNANALGVTNVIARLQLSIDSSNTNWVTLQTIYPTTTNANVDSIKTSFGRVSLPLRLQLVTTNATGLAAYRQTISP